MIVEATGKIKIGDGEVGPLVRSTWNDPTRISAWVLEAQCCWRMHESGQ